MDNIQMVDVIGQYQHIKEEIDREVLDCVASAKYINGPKVKEFQANLEEYLGAKYVIPCANGTDALQIALMALGLKPGDEVLVPAFTYVATAEVIALLGLSPIMVDVCPDTFNVRLEDIEGRVTPRTKAIVPVHLFGQSTDMAPLLEFAERHSLYVIEDNAQSIGADYTFPDGKQAKTGTIGHIGTTSFYPSKNLGCYGDGGAIFTNDDELGPRLRMIANHGQNKRYHHAIIGVNSRLDSIQAAILNVKLKHLDAYCEARQTLAAAYDAAFAELEGVQIPKRQTNSTHVFHQYTLRVMDGKRDALQAHLKARGIPSMIYYPIPLYKQEAFKAFHDGQELPITQQLCQEVLSLPMHTEMDAATREYIIKGVKSFFK
jgi:dTDP-4-amino-4,6-dideoxygalactose transaminase